MVVQKVSSLYTLNKMKRVLRHSYRLYRRKAKHLDPKSKEKIESQLTGLRLAILQKEAPIAARIGEQLLVSASLLMPKTMFDKVRDFICAIAFALIVAVVIRTMWFEPYTIPTGSMRPTLKEGDFLVVSKTDYGVNVPLRPAHFYFDPSLVKRGGICVFSGENMDIEDADTTYFYLFPGKKLFVKRLIAKPGDSLYFYGGKIYGIDAQGKELAELRNSHWAQSLEHIPFIRFEGKADPSNLRQGIFHNTTFSQMNQPVAKLSTSPIGTITGELLPALGKSAPAQYSDLWGIKNYAMARLLTPDQAREFYPNADLDPGILYLELAHHPSLQGAQLIRDGQGRIRPDFGLSISLLPLTTEHIQTIANHMTTCRFVVKNGVAYRYGMNLKDLSDTSYFPRLPDVPDGTYEIQDGKAYYVHFGAATTELPSTHPLYRDDPSRIQLLYNLGIEFLNHYAPAKQNRIHPSRYAYFRNQDLYLLNAPILKKDDPNLVLFLKKEYQKQSISTSVRPYAPFEDTGAPLGPDGKIDTDFIRKHGLTIPEKKYLALGDNHAMSADSRHFGFVPENNLRGGPSVIFWPWGSRWGRLPQAVYAHLTFPNLFVWTTAALVALGSSWYLRRRLNAPLTFPKTTPN